MAHPGHMWGSLARRTSGYDGSAIGREILLALEEWMSGMPSVTVRTVNLDCSDPHEMARFYGGLLGWEPTAVEPDWVLMRHPQGGTGLSFQQIEGYERSDVA